MNFTVNFSVSRRTLVYLLILFCITGCKKYLDQKPNQSLAIPGTLTDLQSLIDNVTVLRGSSGSAEVSADDYYLPYSEWQSRSGFLKRMYVWENDSLFQAGTNNDWSSTYNKIYITNIVLDHIDKIKRVTGDEAEWKNTKGCALFLRSYFFAQMASIFANAYDPSTAATDLGIVLRLNSDLNELSERSTLQQTYDRIINDLKEAAQLLPVTPLHKSRPSKPAALALLARTYLSMRDYDAALASANDCLQQYSTLIDYNDLDMQSESPIPSFNNEVIFGISIAPQPLSSSKIRIDSLLYDSYHDDDLRKAVFFKSAGPHEFTYKGSYDGTNFGGAWFCGLATDEVYLIRAECLARKGRIADAMQDLDLLMRKRWRNAVTYPAFTASNVNEAVDKVLAERRKELIYRGTRWMDIKRLNKEGRDIYLARILNGNLYILAPNDPRYALPIPEDVIAISGMPQNPR